MNAIQESRYPLFSSQQSHESDHLTSSCRNQFVRPTLLIFILFLMFYSQISHAISDHHSKIEIAFTPGQYHFRGSYQTNWTYPGHACKKSCALDQWTGKAMNCSKICQ